MAALKYTSDNITGQFLIYKITIYGIKIPIIWPILVRKRINIDAENLEKFKADRDYKFKTNKVLWILFKFISHFLPLSFPLFYLFTSLRGEPLILSFEEVFFSITSIFWIPWFIYFWGYCLCDTEITSKGIYYRRYLKKYFVGWNDIEDVTETIPLFRPPCCVVILRDKNIFDKYILFISVPIISSPIENFLTKKVTQYIKSKIEMI